MTLSDMLSSVLFNPSTDVCGSAAGAQMAVQVEEDPLHSLPSGRLGF